MSKQLSKNVEAPILSMNDIRRSVCCDSEVHDVPAFYNTTMKLENGENIPDETICLRCGCRCSTGLK